MTKKSVTSERIVAPTEALWDKHELKSLLSEVKAVTATVRREEKHEAKAIAAAHPDCRPSARNLVHSLALSRNECQPFGERLGAIGLTPIARRESNALAVLDAVRGVLRHLSGKSPSRRARGSMSASRGRRMLSRRTKAVLGLPPEHGGARIFANLTKPATDDVKLIRRLVAAGTSGLYIGAGAGDVAEWSPGVEHVRREADRQRRPQQVILALSGPVIETGELTKGSAVLRWEPRRDQFGKLLRPARLWLTAEDQAGEPVQPVEAVLLVSRNFLREVRTEDLVRFKDARGRRRELRIRGAGRSGCLAESVQTTYVESLAPLHLERRGKLIVSGHVGKLPRLDRPVMLFPGDPLTVTREQLPGRPPVRDGGFLRSPARIACTAPKILDQIRVGERIAFGDGAIAGVVESVSEEGLRIRVLRARSDGSLLKPGVRLRFPDSKLVVPAFDAGDEAAVKFAACHVDAIVLPCAERPEDVIALGKALDQHSGEKVGVILGIETRRGVDTLPRLLLAALRRPSLAIRVALDGLVVEYGPTRLGEALAQIEWLARSAHIPLIFPTPELDLLAQHGILSSSALSGAVTKARGECLVIGESEHMVEIVQRLVAADDDSG